MSWEVRARRTDGHGSHLRVSWQTLGTIYDVSIDLPPGVHDAGGGALVRREMNSFSEPMDAHIRWDEDVERPFVILAWADGAEQCEEVIPLDTLHGHGFGSARPQTAASLHKGVRGVLSMRPHILPSWLHGRRRHRVDTC